MFDSAEPLRHLPFFTELASLEDNDPTWRDVSAGLVLLRLVDAWFDEGTAVAASDSWGVRSVRAAIEEMTTGSPSRALLLAALEAMTHAQLSDMRAVEPKLMAYARCLDLDGKWALAADVYETVIAHVHPDDESEISVNALLRRGHCLRQLGQDAEATESFATAGDVAHRHGDMIGALRARIGEAKIIIARGNLPVADQMLRETVEKADAHGLREVRSLASHDRSYIAYTTGNYDAAVRFAYDALRDNVSSSERDRILNDLATSFYMLGVRSAARDAFLILAATACEQYQRWIASINLMELAAEDLMELEFERHRRHLAAAPLPPLLRTQFELHAGQGYRQLGNDDAAVQWMERALGTATEHSLNQHIFAAEKALKAATAPRRRSAVANEPFADIPRELELIAHELREMRLHTMVT